MSEQAALELDTPVDPKHEHRWGTWLANSAGVRTRQCLDCPEIQVADPT